MNWRTSDIYIATRRRFNHRLVALGWGLFNLALVHGHLISAGNGAIQFRDTDAVVLIGVPVSVFHGVDDNADGLLQESEIKSHKDDILFQLANGFSVSVGEMLARNKEALLMSSVHVEDRPGTPQVEWWSLWDFGGNPWANPCTKIRINWFETGSAASEDFIYSVQVRIGAQSEVVNFSKTQQEITFLCDLNTPHSGKTTP